MMVSGAEAQKRCSAVLNAGGCYLPSCREECFKEYNGFGNCIANAAGTSYKCLCFYNC
ncbi:hypothetical protein KSP40_PGU018284 [Platanthera guangdongensis]|uniref:Defensin-like protein n=1 Tax=Platanthera guangdongensis TaxID=2320717 RepID=A0ABR2MTK5_9ASPA